VTLSPVSSQCWGDRSERVTITPSDLYCKVANREMAFIPLLENLEQIMPPASQSEFHRRRDVPTYCAEGKFVWKKLLYQPLYRVLYIRK